MNKILKYIFNGYNPSIIQHEINKTGNNMKTYTFMAIHDKFFQDCYKYKSNTRYPTRTNTYYYYGRNLKLEYKTQYTKAVYHLECVNKIILSYNYETQYLKIIITYHNNTIVYQQQENKDHKPTIKYHTIHIASIEKLEHIQITEY